MHHAHSNAGMVHVGGSHIKIPSQISLFKLAFHYLTLNYRRIYDVIETNHTFDFKHKELNSPVVLASFNLIDCQRFIVTMTCHHMGCLNGNNNS